MDEDLILHEIVKSLAFEIEAVNQDNTFKWTTTNGTPLNVKVRVRNKDEPRLIQRGAIPVPRIGITAPEKLRLISSDQTILSFNVYLEGGLQKDPKRDNGLKKFNIGSCLGTYSDDEGPYLPGSSEQNALESDSGSNSSSDVLKKNMSPVLNSTNTVPRNQKTFFGKCKPGGCLDPPFDEENYAYNLSDSDRRENIQLELTKLEANTKTCEPGGCLDPPFSEDKYPYTNLRVNQQEKQELKSQFTKDKKQALGKKSSEERIQHKTKENKTIKDQEDPKNVTDIYARISKEDSIITYPTDVSSNETLYDQNTNKKLTIKSNDDEAQRQSYDYPVSYFVPPKDFTRNKDDERRYSKRLSSDTINRGSKGKVHDEANKTKSIGHDYMLHNALRSKGIHEENFETNRTDDVASKSYHTNKKDIAATEQENPDPDSVMGTPSNVLTDLQKNGSLQKNPSAAVYKERASRDIKPTESNSNHEIRNFKSQLQTVSPAKSDKSHHVKPESLKQENSKFTKTQSPIKGNSKSNLSCDNDDGVSKNMLAAGATIPVLATTTLALSEKQSTRLNDIPNIGLDSSIIEKGKKSISNMCSEDLLKNTSKQKPQREYEESKNISPQRISSSVNNEFDVSSEHSIDSKHELSNKVEPRKPEQTLGHRNKQDLLVEALNLKNIDNVIVSSNSPKDYIMEDPGSQTKRTSEILQKKPFRSKHDLSKSYLALTSRDIKPTESNSNHEIRNFKSQLQTVSPAESDKSHHVKPESLEENIKVQNWQTRRDVPKAKDADIEINDELPQSEASYITSSQPVNHLDAQREKLDIDSIKQLKQENSKFTKTQSPIKGHSKSNLSCDNDDGVSTNMLAAEATIPVLATTTLALSEKQSTRLNDKPNIGLDSSITEKGKKSISNMGSEDLLKNTSKQKPQREYEEAKNITPQRISSSENNEFDVSSEHSIDSKHELSNKVEPRKPEQTLGHRNKQDLLVEALNSKNIDNVIVSSNSPKDYITVDPGSQTKRTSEILQKKPFRAKHDLDIEQDDINKTAPLKRKTFTVISSNTSIQKREEIEELPDNTTDVYYNITDKSQLGSTESTENSTHISDTNNKNLEGQISLRQKSVPGKGNDIYLNATDDTIPTTKIEKNKEIESAFNTNFNENESHILSKSDTNVNPSNNQTKPLDSMLSENRISTDLLPTDIRGIESNIVDDRESILTVQSRLKTEKLEAIYQEFENTNANYKDTESVHKQEIIQDLNLINDEAKKLGSGNQLMEKVLLNTSSKDKSAMKRNTEIVHLGKRESDKMLNIDSNISVSNQYTDYLRSKTVSDGKFDADYIKELIPENTRGPKINTDDKSDSFTENHEEHELFGIKDVEIKHSNTSGNNPAFDISQKPLTNNAFSDYSADSVNDYKYSNFDATQVVAPEFVQDYDNVMTNKTNDKTEWNDLNYEKLDIAKNPNFIPNTTPEYIEYLQAQTANDRDYADIDQRYDNSELLDARRNENLIQREFTENISELPNIKNPQEVEDMNYELINETESFTKYSSHSGGHSDLISGVLSNITENKEEEENYNVQNRFLEDTNHKFESISKESESNYKLPSSIKSSVSTLKEINRYMDKETKPEARKNITSSFDKLKQRSDTYETDRDGVFIDNTTGIIDQPSEYQSFQTPSSIHDLIGINKKDSRAKPVSHTGWSTHYKQPNLTELKVEEKSNIVATESTFLRDNGPVYLDMSFCSYVNDNKQRIVQTQSPLIESQTTIDGTVTIVKTLIRHGHEIRIPVDNDNDITFNILEKDLKLKTRNSNFGSPMSQNRREKHFADRAKKQNDILNKNLSLIYESELIPLHSVIKDLTQEVNKLATKQETLQLRMRNIKRSKSLRLIPVAKRCGCRRI